MPRSSTPGAEPTSGAYDDTPVLALDFHHSMLVDEHRTSAFHEAIVRTVNAGDVVLDIGTGTGVLALFAARAGARRVYAVEEGPVIELARQVVAANDPSHRITVLEGRSTEIALPEPANVLVTETIGNAGFEEGIVAWVDDARRRLLTPDARFIPRRITLHAALVDMARDYAVFDRWTEPLMRYDFSSLHRVVIHNLQPMDLGLLDLITEVVPLIDTPLPADGSTLRGAWRLTATRAATAHALGVWFEADLGHGISITNGPPSAVPSWQQVILPLPTAIPLDEGHEVEIALEIAGGGRDWCWRAGESAAGSTVYGRLHQDRP